MQSATAPTTERTRFKNAQHDERYFIGSRRAGGRRRCPPCSARIDRSPILNIIPLMIRPRDMSALEVSVKRGELAQFGNPKELLTDIYRILATNPDFTPDMLPRIASNANWWDALHELLLKYKETLPESAKFELLRDASDNRVFFRNESTFAPEYDFYIIDLSFIARLKRYKPLHKLMISYFGTIAKQFCIGTWEMMTEYGFMYDWMEGGMSDDPEMEKQNRPVLNYYSKGDGAKYYKLVTETAKYSTAELSAQLKKCRKRKYPEQIENILDIMEEYLYLFNCKDTLISHSSYEPEDGPNVTPDQYITFIWEYPKQDFDLETQYYEYISEQASNDGLCPLCKVWNSQEGSFDIPKPPDFFPGLFDFLGKLAQTPKGDI